ncbi:sigma-70 family RNA polymerase sigma factor [Bacillus sp. B15-48]|uniref:RNA polymerase sigma factor n=1 Tax=Bacillus sp. B15-48 TaxID=1548601 RepID=UPI00193FA2D3|nr:sigma-70 family RNA polymerase sigma factor [Bacillus sp. B15-48]MBM4763486.1 sigma-70 family RNA polymerase sigma factor [Bacillus sp. B15-48]
MAYELDDFLKNKMNMLFRYLLKMGVGEADAQDIIQDTMIKTLSYLGEIPNDKLNAWLFKVAMSRFYDMYRKKKKEIHIPIEPEHLIDEEGPEKIILTSEQKNEFNELLDQIRPEYKHILLLKYEFHYSYKEISDTLEMKEETVKTWMYRARKQFEKVYRRSEHERR